MSTPYTVDLTVDVDELAGCAKHSNAPSVASVSLFLKIGLQDGQDAHVFVHLCQLVFDVVEVGVAVAWHHGRVVEDDVDFLLEHVEVRCAVLTDGI